ncbi:MAG: hypothetical protein K1V88_07405 [Muribaculaceae bacterium]
MRPMTHGEIRGTIFLMALMAAILLAAILTRRCDSSTPSIPQQTSIPATTQAIDSIRMEERASRYLPDGNADKTGKTDKDTLISPTPVSTGKKNAGKKTAEPRRRGTRRSSPVPSPLDRPV